MSILKMTRSKEREYLPKEFKITVWSRLKPYYNELLKRQINSVEELERWILDRNELDAVIEEDFDSRRSTIIENNPKNKANELFQYALLELAPKIADAQNKLNQVLIKSPFCADLDAAKYADYIHDTKQEIERYLKGSDFETS